MESYTIINKQNNLCRHVFLYNKNNADVNVDATVKPLKSPQDHLRMRQCKETRWINSVKRIYVQKRSPHGQKGEKKKKAKNNSNKSIFYH